MSQPMTYNDLRQLQIQGRKLVVEFLPPILDNEAYAEAGMRAVIESVGSSSEDDVLKISFSFTEFDEFNKPFESSTYYDKNQSPVLTAREAGFYFPVEKYFFMASEPITAFKFVDDKSTALFARYKASDASASMSYVAWLESQISG